MQLIVRWYVNTKLDVSRISLRILIIGLAGEFRVNKLFSYAKPDIFDSMKFIMSMQSKPRPSWW